MPALSAVLLTFNFQFNLLFCTSIQFHVILLDDLAVISPLYGIRYAVL